MAGDPTSNTQAISPGKVEVRASVSDTNVQERLVSGYSGRLFLTVSFGWVLIQLGRQLLPPLLPEIISALAITSTQAGFALTIMWGVYAVCQYPSGRLSDRLTRKTLLVAGLGLLCVGFLVVWQTRSYLMFVGGVGIIGFGAGLYPTAARALVSDLFVERRGQAFGLHTAAGDLGNAAAAGLAVAALAVATWRDAFLPMVVLFVATLVALHVWSRQPYVIQPVSLSVVATIRRVLATRRVRRLLLAYILFGFTWQSTTGFLPTFLQVEKGLSVGLASTGFAVFFLVGMLIKPLAGLLGDRFGRLPVALVALLGGLGGLLALLLAATPLGLIFGIVVFAAGLMSFPPVVQAYLMDTFPDDTMGGDLGGMRTIYIGVGSLGPTYVGYIADLESYTIAFAGLVVCILLCAAMIALITTRL